MICTPHPVLFGDQMDKNEMDGACSAYGGQERPIQDFGGKTWEKEITWETLKSKDNIKMDFQEMGYGSMGWIDLTQDGANGGNLWMR